MQAYFGRYPTSIVLQTQDNFNGTQQTNLVATITAGVSTFASQSGGGLYNFHTDTIKVKNICYYGTGVLSVYKVIGGNQTLIAQLSSPNNIYSIETPLSPNESLSFVSTGAAGSQAVEVIANLAQGLDTL
jgi:hypothetical protein